MSLPFECAQAFDPLCADCADIHVTAMQLEACAVAADEISIKINAMSGRAEEVRASPYETVDQVCARSVSAIYNVASG